MTAVEAAAITIVAHYDIWYYVKSMIVKVIKIIFGLLFLVAAAAMLIGVVKGIGNESGVRRQSSVAAGIGLAIMLAALGISFLVSAFRPRRR